MDNTYVALMHVHKNDAITLACGCLMQEWKASAFSNQERYCINSSAQH